MQQDTSLTTQIQTEDGGISAAVFLGAPEMTSEQATPFATTQEIMYK